jgi:adenosylcobinamide kinase / adenosylcobinamide-phosphate guanylyltransferase
VAHIVLVTGGARSGKSRHAQGLGEALPGPRLFVATMPALDEETARRIERHQRERAEGGWETVEEPVDLAGVLSRSAEYGVRLVECLTLWVNNLMYQAEQAGRPLDEDEVAQRCEELIEACRDLPGTVLLVTNEVGFGIVPENALARQFRDLVGRCNQTLARAADEVRLVVCGYPLRVKESSSE